MTDELTPTEGMNRREMLKRSALVGGAGALMWAAPTVTAFGPRAFAQDGSPASDFSNFGAIVACTTAAGVTHFYKVKADQSGEGAAVTWSVPGNLGGCEKLLSGWAGAVGKHGANDLNMTFVQSGSNYTLTLPAVAPPGYSGCTFALEGGSASSLKQGQCCIGGVVAGDGQSVTWFGPFPNGNANQPCNSHPQGQDRP